MHDLTYKEYIEIIGNSGLKKEVFDRFKLWLLPGNDNYKNSDSELIKKYGHEFVFDLTRVNKASFVGILFDYMNEKILPFLKYKKWKDGFIENAVNKVETLRGSPKNEYIDKVYSLIKSADELSLSQKENKEFVLNLFKAAVSLKNKIEEDSLVQILRDLFKNKEESNLDLDFFKELFAIYIEFINTNPKHQNKINEIKKWGKDQDFSFLFSKYKNVRHCFSESVGEKVFNASVKTYDLKAIAKRNKIKNTVMQQNFSALNSFLNEKLKGNSNIQDFIVLDEKIYHKIVIIYEKRDPVIDSTIKMHDCFFELIKGTEDVETNLMSEIWKSLSLKAELEINLGIDSSKEEEIHTSRKVKKV